MGDESANSSPHHFSAIGGCELTHLSAKSFPRQAGRPKRQAPGPGRWAKKSLGFPQALLSYNILTLISIVSSTDCRLCSSAKMPRVSRPTISAV